MSSAWKSTSNDEAKNIAKIPNNSYNLNIIYNCIVYILNAIPLRAISRVLPSMPAYEDSNTPVWQTVRMWLLRIGYYQLLKPKEKANDWIWIVDHTIQIGIEKCLVVLGIRQKDLPIGRALQYSDLEPIDLVPVKKSNGDIVYDQLLSCADKTGMPCQIVSDEGSDLKSGINKYIEKFKDVIHSHDMKHALALILKKYFSVSEKWSEFTQLSSATKQNVQQTIFAPLAPVNQRSKSRYMNIDVIINWAEKILLLCRNNILLPSEMIANIEQFNDKFSWVLNFEEEIHDWILALQMIKIVEHYLRTEYLMFNSLERIHALLPETRNYNLSTNIKVEILNFIARSTSQLGKDKKYLASSEIIESLFGKYKNIEKEHSKSGFSSLILGMPALVGKVTPQVVMKALTSYKVKDIQQWLDTNLGKTIQSKRATIANRIKTHLGLSWNKITNTSEALAA
jgi:hypothetical protein